MIYESMHQGAAAAELREELTSPIHESQLLICTQTCLISIPLKGGDIPRAVTHAPATSTPTCIHPPPSRRL